MSSTLSKQQKGESVESFYGRLIEQAEKCSLGSEETALIRDAFTVIMIDHETQKELLKETVEPSKAQQLETTQSQRECPTNYKGFQAIFNCTPKLPI